MHAWRAIYKKWMHRERSIRKDECQTATWNNRWYKGRGRWDRAELRLQDTKGWLTLKVVGTDHLYLECEDLPAQWDQQTLCLFVQAAITCFQIHQNSGTRIQTAPNQMEHGCMEICEKTVVFRDKEPFVQCDVCSTFCNQWICGWFMTMWHTLAWGSTSPKPTLEMETEQANEPFRCNVGSGSQRRGN